jgi:hypothetical protein
LCEHSFADLQRLEPRMHRMQNTLFYVVTCMPVTTQSMH